LGINNLYIVNNSLITQVTWNIVTNKNRQQKAMDLALIFGPLFYK
jgi:hypothetical protein